VFTGKVPFGDASYEGSVLFKIMRGDRPPRPIENDCIELSNAVWSVMEACWSEDRFKRPPIPAVIASLEDEWGLQSPSSSPSVDQVDEELSTEMYHLLRTGSGSDNNGRKGTANAS